MTLWKALGLGFIFFAGWCCGFVFDRFAEQQSPLEEVRLPPAALPPPPPPHVNPAEFGLMKTVDINEGWTQAAQDFDVKVDRINYNDAHMVMSVIFRARTIVKYMPEANEIVKAGIAPLDGTIYEDIYVVCIQPHQYRLQKYEVDGGDGKVITSTIFDHERFRPIPPGSNIDYAAKLLCKDTTT